MKHDNPRTRSQDSFSKACPGNGSPQGCGFEHGTSSEASNLKAAGWPLGLRTCNRPTLQK